MSVARSPRGHGPFVSLRATVVKALAALCGVLVAVAAVAEESWKAPRGPGGVHPDLNGVWQALNEANWDIERHLARASVQLREGPMGPVPAIPTLRMGVVAAVPPSLGVVEGGTLPYLPGALAKRDANRARWSELDPEVKCYLPGIPRANYLPQPFQIFQGQSNIEFVYQFAGANRNILMEDPGPAPADSWMGQSVASWEGDTLVIEVTAQNGETWFDRSGNHHSAAMTVVERFTPLGPNHLQYEATIDDPETFTAPWTMRMPLYRRVEPNAMLLDFKCVEFVEELLYGELRRHPLPR